MDRDNFKDLDNQSQHHYGELVAFDRSLGVLRKTLKDLGLENNTILWYCSDNGGLRNILPSYELTTSVVKGYVHYNNI